DRPGQAARAAFVRKRRSLARTPSGLLARALRDRRRVRGAADLARASGSQRPRTAREKSRTPSRHKTRRARTRAASQHCCVSLERRSSGALKADSNHFEAPTVNFLNRRATSSYVARLNGIT